MHATTEIVTLAQAKEYLERRRPNRKLNESVAARYADDMRNDRWIPNGQGIVLDDQGNLIDGQHRMRAIILAQKPISMLVVRGVPAAAMETIDTGRARKLSDVLQMEGYENTSLLASSARAVWNFVAGVGFDYTPTKSTLLSFIKSHDALVKSAKTVKVASTLSTVPRSPFAALLALTNPNGNLDKEAAAFVEGILYGEGLYKGDARLTFRNWLATLRAKHEYSPFSVGEPTFGALIRAWNAYATGKELGLIKFPPHPTRENMEIFGFYDIDWPDVPALREQLEASRLANLEKARLSGKAASFKKGNIPHNKRAQVVREGEAPVEEAAP